MSRTLKRDIPGPDWRVAFEEAAEKGWPAVFGRDPAALGLSVDLGFGRGEFLWHLAEGDPGGSYLGVEYSFKRVLKLARRLARSEVRNVRLLEARAERVVAELLPPASVRAFTVNFPDPWPKARHHKRRLVTPAFVGRLALCLEAGGRLELATDHEGYAEAMEAALAGEPLLENAFGPEPWRGEVQGRLPTAYEREWRAAGRGCRFFRYRRIGGSGR